MKIENKINNVPINLNEMISENCFGLSRKKKRHYNLLSIKGANYHLYIYKMIYIIFLVFRVLIIIYMILLAATWENFTSNGPIFRSKTHRLTVEVNTQLYDVFIGS